MCPALAGGFLTTVPPGKFNLKAIQLINEFSKVAGYKINIQKPVVFLYTKNKLSEREVKKTIPFMITSEIIKYLGKNPPKEVKDLYSENYKTLMKEVEESTNRWKDMLCSWIGRIVKIPHYSRQSTE